MNATETRKEDSTILLVALEPRSYSQAIGWAIAALRPALSVRVVEPQDLVEETARFRPRLVLCSRKKHPSALAATGWIEYHFSDYGPPTVIVNDRREKTPALDLYDMLALIERTLAPPIETPQADHDLPSPIEYLAGSLIDSLTDQHSFCPSTP